jgi:MoaA/NifB/PqqE/SkfB family radical SAM enzyme
MPVEIRDFTTQQVRALTANFSRAGTYFLSDDLHSMLDCASTWDVDRSSPAVVPPLSSPLGFSASGILREEFFGGIYWDREAHRQAMVDRVGFAVLRGLTTGISTADELHRELATTFDRSDIDAAVADLLAGGVIAAHANGTAPRVVPAVDLTKPYLQTPTIVEAELTYGCFRACRHCAYSSSPQARTADELGVEEWSIIFEKLAAAGVLVIQLTGGDPLFRPDSFDIVEAADRSGLSVYVRSDTVALTEENLDRLQALRNLWHIGTSIDGVDAQAHDWMRGKGAFETLIERMTRLSERGIPVAAGATLHRSNFSTVQDIGRVAADAGARWFDIGFLSPVGRGSALADLVLNEAEVRTALDDYLAGVAAEMYSPSHSHYLRRVGRTDPFGDVDHVLPVLPYVTEWPWSRLRIDPTGSTYTAGKLKGSDYAGGFSLVTSDVVHAWDASPNLVALRELGGERIHSLDYRLLRSDHQFQ